MRPNMIYWHVVSGLSPNSTWLVTSRLDTTRRVRPMHFGRVVLVEQYSSTRSVQRKFSTTLGPEISRRKICGFYEGPSVAFKPQGPEGPWYSPGYSFTFDTSRVTMITEGRTELTSPPSKLRPWLFLSLIITIIVIIIIVIIIIIVYCVYEFDKNK